MGAGVDFCARCNLAVHPGDAPTPATGLGELPNQPCCTFTTPGAVRSAPGTACTCPAVRVTAGGPSPALRRTPGHLQAVPGPRCALPQRRREPSKRAQHATINVDKTAHCNCYCATRSSPLQNISGAMKEGVPTAYSRLKVGRVPGAGSAISRTQPKSDSCGGHRGETGVTCCCATGACQAPGPSVHVLQQHDWHPHVVFPVARPDACEGTTGHHGPCTHRYARVREHMGLNDHPRKGRLGLTEGLMCTSVPAPCTPSPDGPAWSS